MLAKPQQVASTAWVTLGRLRRPNTWLTSTDTDVSLSITLPVAGESIRTQHGARLSPVPESHKRHDGVHSNRLMAARQIDFEISES